LPNRPDPEFFPALVQALLRAVEILNPGDSATNSTSSTGPTQNATKKNKKSAKKTKKTPESQATQSDTMSDSAKVELKANVEPTQATEKQA
jgi:hypothetical protein